jgi:hypothetical protein
MRRPGPVHNQKKWREFDKLYVSSVRTEQEEFWSRGRRNS